MGACYDGPMLLALLGVSMATACEGERTLAALLVTMDEAEAQFGVDAERFRQATDGTVAGAECLAEVVTPSIAARLHRIVGLRAYVDQDNEAAARAFAASRRLEPAYVLPLAMAPEGHPLRGAYQQIDVGSTATTRLPTSPEARWLADGRLDGVRVAEWPTLLQRVDAAGRVLDGDYARGGPLHATLPVTTAPVAAATVAAAPPLAPASATAASTDKKRPARALGVAGVATGVAAAAAYGVALAVATEYRDHDVPHTADELNAMRGTANTLVVVSGVAGAGAVALGVGAVVSLAF